MSKLIIATILLASFAIIGFAQTIVINYGCKSYSKDGTTCVLCSDRFYMDGSGICQPVSSACKTYDPSNGACLTCYDGYFLADVICAFGSLPSASSDPYCLKVVNQTCSQCSRGFYLSNSTCVMVNPLCKDFDYTRLVCTGCYSGYSLSSDNTCGVSAASNLAVGCSQFNNSICIKCSNGYYFDVNKVCTLADTLCRSFDQSNGDCLSCYSGFNLANGRCNVDNSSNLNPYCQVFVNSTCLNCSRGYYFDSNKVCQQIDPLCKVFDYANTVCTTCYTGFSLVNGSCTISDSASPSDPNCRTFDSNNLCLNCSKGFYFNQNKVCTQINSNCRSFDLTSLVCTACYSGYDLNAGECVASNASSLVSTTCAQWLDGVCVKCIPRAYYDFQANCVMVSDSCKTFNNFNGKCTSCYSGYSLDNNGNCNESNATIACASTDPTTGLCLRCFNGSYLDASSNCVPIDPQCQAFNTQTRQCDACYKGYSLNSGVCQVTVNAIPTILNCVEYDSNQKCLKCFNLYYLSNN